MRPVRPFRDEVIEDDKRLDIVALMKWLRLVLGIAVGGV